MIKIEEVERILPITQAILGLLDWKITPTIATQTQLRELLKDTLNNDDDTEEIFGGIIPHNEFRTAEMYIWDNLDTNKYYQTLEHTVFHELIHIILQPYDKLFKYILEDESPVVSKYLHWGFSVAEERMVNQLADGYINALAVNQPPK